jgi:hypothetical protein
MRSQRILFVIVAAALVGCGGGSGSGSLPAALPAPQSSGTPSQVVPANAVKATFTVTVPAGPRKPTSHGRRGPQYITSYAEGIDFTTFDTTGENVGYVFYPLTPQSTYCSWTGAPNTSSLICTLQVNAPPGNDTFIVQMYDAPIPAPAYIISAAKLTQTINANSPNTIDVTTNPVPLNITTVPADNGTLHVPVGGSAAITLSYTDPDGNALASGIPFDGPINVSLSGSSNYSLSTNSLSGTSAALSVVNNGTSGNGTVTITFSPGTYAQYFNGGFCVSPSCGNTVTLNVTSP